MNGFLNWKSRNISFTGNNLSYIIYMREYTVYIHKNLKNEKYYVGSTSRKPSYRWNNGKGYQNNSKMWNDIQNSDWNTDWVHGILGKFENKKDALNYEAFLIAMLDSVDNGYNTSAYDSNHYKKTEDTRNKMSESQIGEKAYWFGKHFTEEHKKKISESRIERVLTEEYRRKISEAMTGKHNRPKKPILQFSKDGEFIAEYPSIIEASRQTGCNSGNICSCCMGKYKSAGGYLWRYAS